jgi:hypothetical protein
MGPRRTRDWSEEDQSPPARSPCKPVTRRSEKDRARGPKRTRGPRFNVMGPERTRWTRAEKRSPSEEDPPARLG